VPSSGQNFVHDPNTVRRIVRTAAVGPDDVVLEVGPGLGSLTLALLPAPAHVHAVEIDPALAARLRRRWRGSPPISVGASPCTTATRSPWPPMSCARLRRRWPICPTTWRSPWTVGEVLAAFEPAGQHHRCHEQRGEREPCGHTE
jgi:hypothetical protein